MSKASKTGRSFFVLTDLILDIQVLKALKKGDNALLESPTGTGKTLAPLCSTLAWQRQQMIEGAGSNPSPGN
jgi:Rad3-related DNA helicase